MSLSGTWAGCSSGDPTPEDAASARAGAAEVAPRGQPPEIVSAAIAPESPAAGETLSIAARVVDPDGDRVRVRADWYVNRTLYEMDGELELEHPGLRRGDEVYALVRADDGETEVVFQVPAVRIGNSPPRVTALDLLPDPPSASDTLMVEATVEDADGDAYELHYRWLRNDAILADASGPTLPPGTARRGDQVRLEVWATDAGEGPVYRSRTFSMANARPTIDSKPPTGLASATRYEYQIVASDPDKDRPLRYSLIRGPEQMSVDLVTGLVEWDVPQTAEGKFTIEVGVRDPHGGEARQSYELELHWEAVPANPAEDADAEE
jgi:hypothetical protein